MFVTMKSEIINFKGSDELKKHLEKKAKANDLTLSAYLREIAMRVSGFKEKKKDLV